MKTVVFTAILGDCDSLKPAPAGADRAVCFVDDPAAHPEANGWELRAHQYTGDPRREAWRLRAVPHELFEAYDRIVWIDASFTLTDLPRLLKDASGPVSAIRHHRRSSYHAEAAELVKVGQARRLDIQRQLHDYAVAGYTCPHLSISCILVRDRSDQARRFNETWAAQIGKHLGDNTQVSLDYSAWAHSFTITALRGSRHANPYSTHDHSDHKRRRRPYQVPA